MLHLNDFTYELPEELIAQEAISPRDHARLLVLNRQSGKISHHYFYDLPKLLPPSTTIVVNNTKVFPARLRGTKSTGGKVEVLLTSSLGNSRYHCLTRPGLSIGAQVTFSSHLHGTVIGKDPSKEIERTIQFDQKEATLRTLLSQLGEMPTPPYIKKMLSNQSDYQTIYAKYGFSAAAPTAGLHFTQELMHKLQKTHEWAEVTLDVGLGTFLPVKVDDITTHPMHSEHFTITQTVADKLNSAKIQGSKILAIGTTTMRTLESSTKAQVLQPQSRDTSIYIYPPHQFQYVDALITNFHLPQSTLLMLVSAFTCSPNTPYDFTTFKNSILGRAYQEAIKERYRFFSFGDAMLII
ncbi:MAG: tRNA preQ1(34) S-adenosylmethionine ribosyltransferase-isomerase QueA [bacterium]